MITIKNRVVEFEKVNWRTIKWLNNNDLKVSLFISLIIIKNMAEFSIIFIKAFQYFINGILCSS